MSIIHHIEIYVSQLSRSRKFYDLLMPRLGFMIFSEWREGFCYTDESSYICFVQTREKYIDTPYNRCNTGLNHLAFKCASKKAVDDFRTLFIEHHIPLLYDERYPFAGGEDYYAVFFEDPDRIKLEIVAEH